MPGHESASDFLPEGNDLEALRAAAATCRGCDLWNVGTQTVFGRGVFSAAIMIVGEQPGDREDREGKPFVGPAGGMLLRALRECEIDPAKTYLTNAVKHFKWIPKGKRRIHQRPNRDEVVRCQPWLVAELGAVQPQLVVALGATAAHSLIGAAVRIQRDRGSVVEGLSGYPIGITIHPSAILRTPDHDRREAEMQAFIEDWRGFAGRVKVPA